MKIPTAITLLTILSLPLSAQDDSLLEKVDRRLENISLKKLASVQQTDKKIAPFTTDGCSGGMSDGWIYLADLFPPFQKYFGDKPPWESCCFTHDRVYWRGEAKSGYTKRKQADLELKQCVIQTGKDLSGQLSKKYQLPKKDIEQGFKVAAELMYRAVRIGGKPCSLLPWRWGYGWSNCPLFLTE